MERLTTAHKGRQRIYTDENLITKSNVRQVVRDAMTIHETNAMDIKLLFKIKKGIDELVRDKEVRPEIDIRAIEPLASQIVDFKVGYEHGEPISYIQRANVDSDNPEGSEEEAHKDDVRVVTLNEMMREINKASKDIKMATDIKTCGIGFRYVVPKRVSKGISPFDIYVLNPERTFVIYSNDAFCEPVCAVTYTENMSTKDKKFGVWTNDWYFEFSEQKQEEGIKQEANLIGMIPIIECINNEDIMGSFERELPLMNSLNVVTSDRVNDVSQQVQSILWLHNTKLDDEQKSELAEGGVIQTQANADGKDAKIQYVNSPLRQNEIQTLASYLKERILESAGVPKLSEGQNATGEAMKFSNGWHVAETQAKTSELTWRDCEDQTLEVCLAIIRDTNTTLNDVGSLKVSDVDYKPHRSENYDIVSRVNAFVTLTDRGFDLAKAAMYCKITDDPLQFVLDSEENVNKIRFSKLESENGEAAATKVLPSEQGVQNQDLNNTDIENKAKESIQPSTVRY